MNWEKECLLAADEVAKLRREQDLTIPFAIRLVLREYTDLDDERSFKKIASILGKRSGKARRKKAQRRPKVKVEKTKPKGERQYSYEELATFKAMEEQRGEHVCPVDTTLFAPEN